jgi:hypothetical protein
MLTHVHRYVLSLIFFGFGAVTGLACGDDGGGSISGASLKDINASCQAYCDKARVCDDEVVISQCVADCKDRLGDCMADEQQQTVDDLNTCADDACDDFRLCTAGAGLQCRFGL